MSGEVNEHEQFIVFDPNMYVESDNSLKVLHEDRWH